MNHGTAFLFGNPPKRMAEILYIASKPSCLRRVRAIILLKF